MSKPTGKLIRVTPEGIGAVATSSVVQSTGSSTTQVMSQKAVTNLIGSGSIGVNQKWTNFTSQRRVDVTYTNTTGKPIQISIYYLTGNVYKVFISVDNLIINTDVPWSGSLNLVIPNNSTYRLHAAVSSGNFSFEWLELR